MEKFIFITFVICLLGTIQCSLADESEPVEGQLDENGRYFEKAKGIYAGVISNVQSKVNDSVQKVNEIRNQVISDVSTRVTTAAKNSYFVGKANDALNNMVIPLPYSVKNTQYGEYMNNLSRQLNDNVKVLAHYMTTINDTVGDVSNATQNLLRQAIDQLRLKRDGPCYGAVQVLEQNFTSTLIGNFKVCVSQVSKSLLLFTTSMNEMQTELNTALQDGKFRVGLLNEIVQSLASLPDKANEISGAIPECHMTQIANNFLLALTNVGSKCYYSFFEK